VTTIPGWTDGLPYKVFRAHQVLRRLVDEAFAEIGVTASQLGVVVHLAELGRLSGSDVARSLHISPQAASTSLSALERLEWVRRVPHPSHGRIILYELTDAGVEGGRHGLEILAALHTDLEAKLSEQQIDETKRLLSELVEHVEGPQPEYNPVWPLP
jgi:DNA-binding MarR family transcriptional regulator